MRGINRRVRGIKEEAKGVANRAAYHVASAMEATFPVRRRVGQRPPDHGKVASFSRVPGPSPGNSGHDPGQDRPNSAEILGIGAIAPLGGRLGGPALFKPRPSSPRFLGVLPPPGSWGEKATSSWWRGSAWAPARAT